MQLRYESFYQFNPEEHALVGPKLIEQMLLNCRGEIDDRLDVFIAMALERLATAQSRQLQILLIEVPVNAILYAPDLACRTLAARGWLGLFMGQWLDAEPGFTRMHDKKLNILTVLALIREYPDVTKIPADVAAALPRLMGMMGRLLEGLEAQREAAERESDDLGDGGAGDDEGMWGDGLGAQKELDDDDDAYADDDEATLRALTQGFTARAEEGGLDGLQAELEEDEEESTTPLDDIDELFEFFQLMQSLSAAPAFAPLLAGLPADVAAQLQAMMQLAQRRANLRNAPGGGAA